MADIETQGVGKSYGTFRALDDVSLTARSGEFLTLLGPSGSGKTTFLMILAGFVDPTEGSVLLNGGVLTDVPVERRGFGMVFQGYALFPHMTVRDNIAFPLKVQGRTGKDIAKRVDDMIDLVGLAGHAHKKPSGLSGGQQQRVALARALAYEPPVLLLDEPFSALDKNLRGQMQDEVRRIHKELGTTFVFVTHDQSEALALSDHIAIFDHGKLQQFGTPEQVYDHPANRFVAEFLGDINILAIAVNGTTATIEGTEVRLPPGSAVPQGSGHLAVRPEHMQLSSAPDAGRNNIRARVAETVYQGSSTRVLLSTDQGHDINLMIPAGEVPESLAQGTEVWASWAPEWSILL